MSVLLSPCDLAVILELVQVVILELVQVVTRHHPVTAGIGSSTPMTLSAMQSGEIVDV